MGFIEDLRRQREEELSRPKEISKPDPGMRADLERPHGAELKAKSRQYYKDSGLPSLIRELKKLGAYEEISEYAWDKIDHTETFWQKMTISTIDILAKQITKSITIEVDAWGTVFFRGGFLGSSTISRSQWEKDKDALEIALGKSYKHPKIEIGDIPSESSERPGGFGW